MPEDVYRLSVSRHLPQRADRPALSWGARTLSYAELDRAVHRHAGWLCDVEPTRSACIGLVFDTQASLALSLLALARLRRPFLVIPRTTPPRQAAQWCARAGIEWVLTDRPNRCAGLPMAVRYPDDLTDGLTGPWPRELTAAAIRDAAPEDLFTVIGGSGSTGRSKLIPVSQAQMCERILDTAESLQLSDDDHSVGLIHLEFASAQHRLLAALCAGGRVTLSVSRRNDWLRQLQACRATVVSAGVIHVEALLRSAASLPAPALPDVRALTMAGSTVPDALRARVLDRLTPNPWVVYGSNECWYATVATPAMVRAVPGTIGVASSRSDVRIANAAGGPAPAGEIGRIAVRSASIPAAYLDGTPEENSALSNGYFDTGDLGRQEPGGQIIYLGRADNLMICNGVNVYPIEIEQCALAYPGVAQAAAFPMQHPVHQNVPLCAVAFSTTAPRDTAGLLRHLSEELGFLAPVGLYVFDELPLISHGKPSVREIVRRINADRMEPILRTPPAKGLSA